MLAQCPDCHTVFRASLEQLEAAGGRVRCGQCSAIFNALSGVHLRPDIELPDPQDHSSEVDWDLDLQQISDPLAETDEHELLEVEIESTPSIEITMEGEHIDIDGEAFTDESPPLAESESHSKPDLEPSPSELPRQPDAPEPEPAAQPDVDGAAEPSSALPAESAGHEIILPSGTRVEFGRKQEEESVLPSLLLPKLQPEARKLWLAGGAFLALLLAVQLVHLNRDLLARTSIAGPVVKATYEAFGAELSPHWDLQAYEIHQWGATADSQGGGTLRVRASLVNTADRAQPYPLLRLMLQDRFGQAVGARDLSPNEYLPGEQARELLEPGHRADAQIAIVDPGTDAVGFQIEVCLQQTNGVVICAK